MGRDRLRAEVALRGLARRPLAFGALAGLGIGTVGLAAEWAWSHIWWTIPWTGSLLPEALIAGVLAGIAGGVMGGFIGRALRAPTLPTQPEARWLAPAAAVAALALVGFTLPASAGDGARAQVSVRELTPPPERTIRADVKLDPPGAAEDAHWFTLTAWQGGGSVVDNLERTGPGQYRTGRPIPRAWKLEGHAAPSQGKGHRGGARLPPPGHGDPGRGGPRGAALHPQLRARQEEPPARAEGGVSAVLVTGAYLTVLLIGLGLFWALAWGLARFAEHTGPTPTARHTDLERTTA